MGHHKSEAWLNYIVNLKTAWSYTVRLCLKKQSKNLKSPQLLPSKEKNPTTFYMIAFIQNVQNMQICRGRSLQGLALFCGCVGGGICMTSLTYLSTFLAYFSLLTFTITPIQHFPLDTSHFLLHTRYFQFTNLLIQDSTVSFSYPLISCAIVKHLECVTQPNIQGYFSLVSCLLQKFQKGTTHSVFSLDHV